MQEYLKAAKKGELSEGVSRRIGIYSLHSNIQN